MLRNLGLLGMWRSVLETIGAIASMLLLALLFGWLAVTAGMVDYEFDQQRPSQSAGGWSLGGVS